VADGVTLVEVTDQESTFRTRGGKIFKVPYSLANEVYQFISHSLPSLMEGLDQSRKPWYGEIDLKFLSKIILSSRRYFGNYSDEVFDYSILPFIIKECENILWRRRSIEDSVQNYDGLSDQIVIGEYGSWREFYLQELVYLEAQDTEKEVVIGRSSKGFYLKGQDQVSINNGLIRLHNGLPHS